ncbi:hypothetical protein ACNQO6_08660 [Acinetobacter calcoaceticus]|uniref:hypothetical protein n=1 Tax=Acinetobacter calcoaceticus TaxID=471 RepID=UPI003F7B50B6
MSNLHSKTTTEFFGELEDLALVYIPKAIKQLHPSQLKIKKRLDELRLKIINLSPKLINFINLSNNSYNDLMSNRLEEIIDNIQSTMMLIENDQPFEKITNALDIINNKLFDFENFFKKPIPILIDFNDENYLNTLIGEINNKLSKKDKDILDLRKFSSLPKNLKTIVYRKLIVLRNLIVKDDYDDTQKDQIIYSIAEQFTQQENIKKANEIVQNIENTAQNINISISERNNKEILKAFEDEASELKNEIENLNYIIIILFCIIILTLFMKGVLAIIFEYAFRDIYNIFIFITIIISMTGLLTYVIKERARNVKLYDFYKQRYLELNALPEFISELTSEERRELIKELARTYFNGKKEIQNIDTTDNKMSEISKYTEELKKLADNIKGLIK